MFGTANCTKAVWETMREQNYGRIMLTSSASGIYGNFHQSNYGAAKAAMIGLMNVLSQEGAKSNIRVNTLAPAAATRMLEGLFSEEPPSQDGARAGDVGRAVRRHENAKQRRSCCALSGSCPRISKSFPSKEIVACSGRFIPNEKIQSPIRSATK